MSDAPLEAIEETLDRATDLSDDEALSRLQSAKRDLEAHRTNGDATDEKRVTELEDRLNQRIREVSERDAYDSGMGASMEPDDENAP